MREKREKVVVVGQMRGEEREEAEQDKTRPGLSCAVLRTSDTPTYAHSHREWQRRRCTSWATTEPLGHLHVWFGWVGQGLGLDDSVATDSPSPSSLE